MFSALLLKSCHDLSKRKARSIFTILTITLGVMGLALFAINPLAERTIDVEIEDQNLYNLRISIPDTQFNRSDLDRLIERLQAREPRDEPRDSFSKARLEARDREAGENGRELVAVRNHGQDRSDRGIPSLNSLGLRETMVIMSAE